MVHFLFPILSYDNMWLNNILLASLLLIAQRRIPDSLSGHDLHLAFNWPVGLFNQSWHCPYVTLPFFITAYCTTEQSLRPWTHHSGLIGSNYHKQRYERFSLYAHVYMFACVRKFVPESRCQSASQLMYDVQGRIWDSKDSGRMYLCAYVSIS